MQRAAATDRTLLLSLAVFVLALGLRAGYLLGAHVDVPIRGDILEYWSYAWNMLHHGVFSVAQPAAAVPTPDAWRTPGYPAFLALCLKLGGDEGALALAQWLQVFLSAALAPLAIVFGRRFLPPPWALAAGALVAIWPHLVVFAGTLLSETLFGLMLLLAAMAAERAFARASLSWALLAGLAAGLAYLVNPILMLFPPALALLLAWRGQGKLAAVYLLGFALLWGAWALRNASIAPAPGASQRVAVNFVQGSWPEYHSAYNDRTRSPIAREYNDHIADEGRLFQADPRAGWAAVRERLEGEPGRYLRWYFLQKPWLLWDWNVRIGWGDVYYLETHRSPYERSAVFKAMHAFAKALNPLLFAFALLGGLVAAGQLLRKRDSPAGEGAFPLQYSALLLAYLTAVHVVLQAEPRYSVPYRPFEILLALAAMATIVARLRARGHRAGSAPAGRED